MARLQLAVALGLMAVACSSRTNVPRPEGASALTGPAIVAAGAVSVPHLPKDRFALPTFDFGRFQTLLRDLAGNHVPVVVNIWASWCGPCRIESPNLVMAAERYGRQVQFLGVDIIDQKKCSFRRERCERFCDHIMSPYHLSPITYHLE